VGPAEGLVTVVLDETAIAEEHATLKRERGARESPEARGARGP